MMLKIGNLIFSPTDQPIMVILTQADMKEIVKHVKKDGMKYTAVPANMKSREIKKFMLTDGAKFAEVIPSESGKDRITIRLKKVELVENKKCGLFGLKVN